MSVRPLTLRKVAKSVGAVVLAVVALDLIATFATLSIAAQWLRR